MLLCAALGPVATGELVPEAPAPRDASTEPWIPDRPWEVIEVAIALDVSGTMQPVLEAVRLNLWEIVAELSRLEPSPTLRVALLTYGSPLSDAQFGWVRIEADLTLDLDAVSERVFALETGGDTEYVARALLAALQSLSWTESGEALKLIFVTGNEAADQDPEVSLEEVSEVARRQGISVHTVFCGDAHRPDATSWKALAGLVESHLATIDHRAGPLVMQTPYDEALAELGAAINETYVPLGEEGEKRRENLLKQDENARKAGVTAVASRAGVKSSPAFAAAWDLVDALEAGSVALDDLEVGELPEDLRRMSAAERELYVEEIRLRREELRRQTAELGQRRRQHVADQIEARGLDTSRTFDAVVGAAGHPRESGRKGFPTPRAPVIRR